MALPKLSAQQPIVNPDRTPSSPFLQFMEKTRTTQIDTDTRQDAADAAILQLISDLSDAVAAIAAAQAAATAADAKAVAAQTTVDGALAGTTAFTGLKVGAQNVKPFLDKTDGSTLTNASGLDDALVSTAKIAAEAVTTVDVAFASTTVTVTTTAETTLLTKSVTVAAGETVDLQGVVDVLTVSGGSPMGNVSALISVMLYRDSTLLLERIGVRAIKQIAVALSCPTSWTDEPAAGTYSYTLRVKANTVTDISTLEFSNAHLTATRIKR